MKIFIPLFISILLFTAASILKTGQLSGIVKDKETGEAIAFATIKVTQKGILVKGTISDLDGKYALDLEPGTYSIECTLVGYQTIKYEGVQVFADKMTTFDIEINPSTATLSEVVVNSPKMETRKMEGTASGVTLTSDEAVIRASRSDKSTIITGRVAGVSISKSKDYEKSSAKPVMSESTKYTHDLNPDILYEPASTHDAISDKFATATPPNETKKAGQLTAGEWNDLQNWGNHWNDLLTDGEIEQYENMYRFYPQNRYAAILQNEDNFPIADVKVRLVDEKGQNIWQTRSDNTGKAELWSGLFDTMRVKNAFVEAEIKGKYQRLGAAKHIEQGINFFKIAANCKSPNQLDIVWAVDATGSMSDEIDFLKSEVLDVIGRVKQQNNKLAVRMGSVFYRDKGDEYLTRNSPLTADIKSTVNFIQNQEAGGGGDYPEAVHTALEEAIEKMAWSEKAIALICFLVLDASPHQEPEVIASLQKSIKLAAEKGIRIVPLSASGIQKDTEFLMKFFGLATNGTYLFLTDHSGIGGKHLEPTTEEYKVEMLNDLLVRIITEYATMETCDGKSVIRFTPTTQDSTTQNQQNMDWEALFYPNPASGQFNLSLPVNIDVLTIFNSEGKAVKKLTNVKEGITQVQIADLPEGVYLLRIQKDNEVQSGKLMVISGL
jgi:hypothetical protein